MPKRISKAIRVTPDFDSKLWTVLKARATAEGTTVAQALNRAMRVYLNGDHVSDPLTIPMPPQKPLPLPRWSRPKLFVNSDLLYDYMRKNTLNDGDMATKLEITRENFNRIIHHRMQVSAKTSTKLIKVTGLTYDQLFNSATSKEGN